MFQYLLCDQSFVQQFPDIFVGIKTQTYHQTFTLAYNSISNFPIYAVEILI